MTRIIKKIISYLLVFIFFLPGACWAKGNDCLAPGSNINDWAVQRAAREMIIEYFAGESVVSNFDYFKLKLDVIFGTKIRAKEIEDKLRSELSAQDIMLFIKANDVSERTKIRLKVINIFGHVLKKYALWYDATMANYLDVLMEVFYQELKLKIDTKWEYILTDLKKSLQDDDFFKAEEVLVYNQAFNSVRKHEVRKKVRDAARKKLASHGVFFSKEVEGKLNDLMAELKQELLGQIDLALAEKGKTLIKNLFDGLSGRQRAVYLSPDSRLNIERQKARSKAKDIFQAWLKDNNVYFEGENWEYYYSFRLGEIMQDVLKRTPDVYLRAENSTDVFNQKPVYSVERAI